MPGTSSGRGRLHNRKHDRRNLRPPKFERYVPENTQSVAGEGLLVRLDLGPEFRGHGHHAAAEEDLGAAVDDALGGSLHHDEALAVGLVLLLHDVHLAQMKETFRENSDKGPETRATRGERRVVSGHDGTGGRAKGLVRRLRPARPAKSER